MPLSAEPPAAIAEDLAQIRRLRLASFLEACTLVALLLIAVPLKYGWGYPVATRIMGPAHGAAFVAYGWSLIVTVAGGGWHRHEVIRLGVAAFIPFGGFFNAGLLRRKAAALAAPLGQP